MYSCFQCFCGEFASCIVGLFMDHVRSAKATKGYREEDGNKISRAYILKKMMLEFVRLCWSVGLFVGTVFSYGT